MYAIIDTESSKLPDFKLPADHPDQPRVAELVIIYADKDLTIERTYHAYIKPEGWTMEPGATAVNNLTTEFLASKGVPIREALDEYTRAIAEGRIVVAHNAQFDCKMMRGELRRSGMPDLFEQTKNICTMRALTDVCKIPPKGGRGGYKFPKLSEACVHFNFPLVGDHSALNDARACMQLLGKMIALNVLPEAKVHLAKEGHPAKPDANRPLTGKTATQAIQDDPQAPPTNPDDINPV